MPAIRFFDFGFTYRAYACNRVAPRKKALPKNDERATLGQLIGCNNMWYDLPYLGSIGGNLICLFVIYLFDKMFAPKKARWFAIHAFANAIVVATCISSTLTVIVDPVHAADSRVYNDRHVFGNASPWPILVINAVHVCHMIAFSNLTSSDYFHHLMFIPLGFRSVLRMGRDRNFLCLFISGCRRSDYFMLMLVKLRYIDVITQKRVCAS